MSLLSDAEIVGLVPVDSPDLPQPTSTRWKPLRCGLIDVWQYDDARFRFGSSGLLLHGRNQSGKTKVLEMVLPFLLNGDISPRRLDPHDSRYKTMRWNIIDWRTGTDRRTVVAYAFLEFGRLGDDGRPRFFSTGAGFKATAGSTGVEYWLWTLPHRRIDADIELAPEQTPLLAAGLREAIGEANVHGHGRAAQESFRDAIRAVLYPGLTAARYTSLVQVMLNLRRPQLAAKLDVSALHGALTEALPPLDADTVTPLLERYNRLEAQRREVQRLAVEHGHLDQFLAVYRRWARKVVHDQAAAYTRSTTEFDNVARQTRAARLVVDESSEALAGHVARRADLDHEQATAQGQLNGLDTSALSAIQDAEGAAEAATAAVAAKASALERTEQGERQARSRHEATAALVRQRDDDLDTAVTALNSTLHELHLGASAITAPDGFDAAHAAVAPLRPILVRHGRAREAADLALDAQSQALRVLDDRVRAHDQAVMAADQAAEQAAAAEREADAGAADWAERTLRWAREAAATAGDQTPDDLEVVAGTAYDAILDGNDPTASLTALFEPARIHLAGSAQQLRLVTDTLRREAAAARAQAADLEATTTNPPPTRPGIPEGPRIGTPLWDAVEFTSHLDVAERAGLEAALDAAGLLDAVVDGGDLATSSETAYHHTAAPVADPTETLATALTPVDAAPPRTAVALTTVALVPAGHQPPDHVCWVSPDGRWRNGPLHGAWTKPEAVYIGAAARAAANARRAAVLRAEADAASAQAAGHESDATAADDTRQRLTTAPPSVTAPLAARRKAVAAATAAGAASLILATADRAVVEQRTQVERTRTALSERLSVLGLTVADPDLRARLGSIRDTLTRATVTIERLPSAAREAARAHHEAAASLEQLDGLRRQLLGDEQELRMATNKKVEADAAARTARASLGTKAEEVRARQEHLRAELARVRSEMNLVGAAERRVIAAKAKAEGQLEELESEQARRAAAREGERARFATTIATPLYPLAVGPTDVPQELTTTSARELATEITRRLSSTQRPTGDGPLINGFNSLRTDLPELALSLTDDSHGPRTIDVAIAGGTVDISAYARQINEQLDKARADLTDEEQRLIADSLIDNLARKITDRIDQAKVEVENMNTVLKQHLRPGADSLRLRWRIAPTISDDDQAAASLLSKRFLAGHDRETRNTFLVNRISAARRANDDRPVEERILEALDYRRFHAFDIDITSHDGTHKALNERSHATGSGGSKARLLHLALFATAASYFDSTTAKVCPRLVGLDEAFEGIDDAGASDVMGLAAELDLDVLLTTYHRWCAYRTVKDLTIYDLHRHPTTPGVTALAYRWHAGQRTSRPRWDT